MLASRSSPLDAAVEVSSGPVAQDEQNAIDTAVTRITTYSRHHAPRVCDSTRVSAQGVLLSLIACNTRRRPVAARSDSPHLCKGIQAAAAR